MNQLRQAARHVLRGERVSRLLRACGVDPRRYWLLIDLFGQLSGRREMLSQLGRDRTSLKVAAWIYFGFSTLIAVMLAAAGQTASTYLPIFMGITAFLLTSVLVSEVSDSLVNPVEALVLAHQPVDGATYIAAKLTHLGRILLYFVPGLNALPALAGLLLKGSRWFYPIEHMAAAFAVGIVAALLCCAVFGWLIRFLPPARLKSAGQIAEMLPWLLFFSWQYGQSVFIKFHRRDLLRHIPIPGAWSIAGLAVISVVGVVFGIRSLSVDYLVRVSSIIHGRPARRAEVRRSALGEAAGRLCGGQAGRAGYEYVRLMMLRDWAFRRQLIPVLPVLIAPVVLLLRGWRTDPFSAGFTALHVLPHLFAFLLLMMCIALPYGNDHKGAALFQLAPSRAFGPFAGGVWICLWIWIVLLPHLLLLAALIAAWGIRDAGLFIAYSIAMASAWLGLEFRLVDAIPFSKQPVTNRNTFLLPLMLAGGIVIGILVALQYYFIFRSPLTVVAAIAVMGVAAILLTRSSLDAFAVSMRFHLGLASAQSSPFYREIDT